MPQSHKSGVSIMLILIALCFLTVIGSLVWVGFRLFGGRVPPVDYPAAHTALVELGQPSAQEAENAYDLLDELGQHVEQRQNEINAREKRLWEECPANDMLLFGDERFRWWLLTRDSADDRDDLDRRMREVAEREYERLDAEGLFDRIEEFSQMRRYVPPPRRGLIASGQQSALKPGARMLTTLLTHRMVLAADRGDAPAMETALRQGLRIGRSTQRGRTIMDELMGMSQCVSMLSAIRELLIDGRVPEGASERLLAIIEASGVSSAMAQALDGERMLVLDDLQEIYSGRFAGPEASQFFKLYRTHRECVQTANDRFDVAISLVNSRPAQRRAAADKAELLDSEIGLPLEMLMPSLARLPEFASQMDTQVAATRLMLMLQMFHDRRGEYPASLIELVPLVAPSLPVDPHDPTDRFGYRLLNAHAASAGDGYLLYSVGIDGMDNGGALSNDDRYNAFDEEASGTDFVYCGKE